MNRRDFLRASTAAASLWATLPADLLAQSPAAPPAAAWDAGRVRHLLPTVSDTRILIKASFDAPCRRRRRSASASSGCRAA